METVDVEKVGSNPDVLPTILNLFGIEYDSRLIMGQDLLSDKEGLVVFANRSWISDKVKYNSVTSEIIARFEDIEVDNEYIEKLNNLVDNQFKISNLILQNNYYKNLFMPDDEENEDQTYLKSTEEEKID
jgi:lipoteichoic acid synthase